MGKTTVPKHCKILPIKMHMLRKKIFSILLALGQKKMRLKSDRLEHGLSIVTLNSFSNIIKPSNEI